jgi:hypothetical protein
VEKMSGVYAVVVLEESLRNSMGDATLTLEYLRCGSLECQTLRVPLDARDVADDRQIYLFWILRRKRSGNFSRGK